MLRYGSALLLFAIACGSDDAPSDDGTGMDAGTRDLGGAEIDAASGTDATTSPGPRSDPAAYIRDAHPSLIVELDVVEGVAPRDGVGALMIGALEPLLAKPGGISIQTDDTIPASRALDEWTFADVEALALETFDQIGPDDSAVFHTLWLTGRYVSDSGGTILGIAWANRYLAIFADTIDGACSGALPLTRERVCREAEAAVWTHEAGHVIGLVNNPLPMVEPHEDPEHPGHTSNRDGVMYWSYEGPSFIDALIAGSGPDFAFGPESMADVAAFRDGG